MSSLIDKPYLDEGKVLGGGTVVAYFFLGIFIMLIVFAFIYQKHGVVAAGTGLWNSFLNLLMSPINGIKDVLITLVSYIYNLIYGFVNGVGTTIKGGFTYMQRFHM